MSKAICITTLVDNSVHRRGLRAEHGLAFHVALGRRQVLFDTGDTDLLLHNAHNLGLDLTGVEAVVLSHGHHDHIGGLAAVRRLAPHAPIVAHPAATSPKFTSNPDGTSRSIGMTKESRAALAEGGLQTCGMQPMEIAEGIFVTGEIPRTNTLEDVGGRFFLDEACQHPDPLLDDMAVFCQCPEGTVVLLGCAHAGVINTLRHIESCTGSDRFAAVIGGMHLLTASEARMEFTLSELRRRNIPTLVPMHCTGWTASLRFWQSFPGRCLPGGVGSSFQLGS